MTTQEPRISQPRSGFGGCPVAQKSPADTDGPRVSLHSDEFAADPHGAYRDMRHEYGSLVPVELAPDVPATLVVGYQDALRILNDPEHFPADPRAWQDNIPDDSPVKPMLMWYPNALRNSGAAHARYRQAYVDAIDGIDLNALHTTVEQLAVPLINSFCEEGSADLLSQYATPLVFEALSKLVGCPPETAQRVAAGMAALFDSVNAAWGMEVTANALMEVITARRAEPRQDVVSRMVQHPSKLTDEELLYNLVSFYGAGLEPGQNLIGNTLLLMLTDDRFGGDMLGGSLSTRDALDEVLFNDPPMANFSATYPRQPILIGNTWLPAHQPVLVSLAGCNDDPQIRGGDRTGNRSHLAWSLGPHACPAQSAAFVIAQEAIDQLLDALPELELSVPIEELSWRPGPFHRAMVSLPVVFPQSPPLNLV